MFFFPTFSCFFWNMSQFSATKPKPIYRVFVSTKLKFHISEFYWKLLQKHVFLLRWNYVSSQLHHVFHSIVEFEWSFTILLTFVRNSSFYVMLQTKVSNNSKKPLYVKHYTCQKTCFSRKSCVRFFGNLFWNYIQNAAARIPTQNWYVADFESLFRFAPNSRGNLRYDVTK